uniref:NADH-ubiquinone oxidoreductase chain 6 n=1 Tax=Parathyginus sp. TaxID=2931301 RepID=A0A8T9ZWT1_9HEMI|nr:NADH dehydrogenase subunit 6 [Parathyginus sp.]
MMMLLYMMNMLSLIFMWLNHPLSMGITVIIQSLTVAAITGMMMGSFWFSYIIVITMLSGMLVLFIYMASIASNEKFKTPTKLISVSMMILIIGVIMQMTYNNQEEYLKILTENNTEEMILKMLFNSKFMFITMTMVMYLFFTMVVVSFIVNIHEGPLRVKK